MTGKPPAGGLPAPLGHARVGIEGATRAADSNSLNGCLRRAVERRLSGPSERSVFLPSGYPAPPEGAVEAQGHRAIGGPVVWRRLCWTLNRRAQADPGAGPAGSAGRRREALRPSPLSGGSGPRAGPSDDGELERTSAGQVLCTALNTATGRKLKRRRQTFNSAPYLPLETHTERGSHYGVRELGKYS